MLSKKLLSACQETGTPVDRYYNISWGKSLNFNARRDVGLGGNGKGDVHPINSYWGRSLIAFTYTAAELSGCGLVSGAVIKKLRYFANEINSSSVYPWPNYAIAMCHISSGTKNSDPVTSSRTNFTTVKAQHNFTPPGATSSAQESYNKFIEFTLDTNFTWNGTDAIGFIFAHGQRPSMTNYDGYGVGEMVTDGKTYFARDDASGTYTVNDTSYTSQTTQYAGYAGDVGSRPIVQMYATQSDTAGNYGNVPLFFNDLYCAILHGFNGGSANADTLSSSSSDSTADSSQFASDDGIRIGFEVTPYRSAVETHSGNATVGVTGLRSDMARHVPIQSATNNSTNAYWKDRGQRPDLRSDDSAFTDYEDDYIQFKSTNERVATVDAVGTNLTNITDGSVVFLYRTDDAAFLFLNEGPYNSYQGFLGAYSYQNGYYNDSVGSPSILLNNSTITSLYTSARSNNWSMLEFRGVNFSGFSSSEDIGINDYHGPTFRSSNFDFRAMLIFKNKLDNTKAAELKTYFEDNSGVY